MASGGCADARQARSSKPVHRPTRECKADITEAGGRIVNNNNMKPIAQSPEGRFLLDLFDAGLQAVHPRNLFAGRMPSPPRGRTIVIGAGKAAASMAQAFEDAWQGGPLEGLVVTRYGHGAPTRHIEVVEAAHPVPDEAGTAAARRILALARGAGAEDLVVCLISGGASALLAMPLDGVTLEQKQKLNTALLRSGAPIDAMNTVRKALSAIKGGGLLAAIRPAHCVTYLISDVPGDDPSVIGSGPTIAGEDPVAAAFDILRHYDIDLPGPLADAMRRRPPVPAQAAGEVVMLATAQTMLEAAADHARKQGVEALILGDAIEGEAREVGRVMAGIALQTQRHDQPIPRPCVLLSGGETTVTITGKGGRGGRNGEFLLGFLQALGPAAGIWALACDTDGIDGSEDNAGAIVGPDTFQKMKYSEVHLQQFLKDHDSYSFFYRLSDLIVSGPTLTNVNDFRVIYSKRLEKKP